MAEVKPNGNNVTGTYRIGQPFTLRAATASTSSYVATSHMRCIDAEQVSLDFALVWADSTSTEWYVEWSQDGTTWYRSINLTSAAGLNTATLNSTTISNAASANWNDGPIPVQDNFMRVLVKKTGGVGADTLAVFATLLVNRSR